MLQAHSPLWQYLWLAPNVLGLGLAACLLRRGLQRRYPVFFCYLVFVSLEQFCLYALDLSPRVSPITWWRAFWIGTIIECLLKFAVVAELLQTLLHSWPSVARLARNLVSGAGVLLVLLAAVAAAFTAPDNTHWLVGGAHILLQTLYIAQAGLIVSIFLVAAIFRIPWDRNTLGIALGFGVVWCVHLAVSALVAGGIVRNRDCLDIANMGTYHICVLMWFYYLLVPSKVAADSRVALPENNLDVWNRELERLIHQ